MQEEYSFDPQHFQMQLEAIKSLGDFAKWLIAVETTTIAGIGYITTIHGAPAGRATHIIASVAVIAFILSVPAATSILRSLPSLLQSMKPGQDVWSTEDRTPMGVGVKTSTLVAIETVSFAVGLLMLGGLLAFRIYLAQ